MINLTGMLNIVGSIGWQYFPREPVNKEEGLAINFVFLRYINKRDVIISIKEALNNTKNEWLIFENNIWIMKLSKIKEDVKEKEIQEHEWLKGDIIIEPDIDYEKREVFNKLDERTIVRFIASKEAIIMSYPKKIFLSHKGVDKPIVREFKDTLEILGFTPWLDEAAMAAGTELERGLLQGFKDSCAAIFFITPSFKDEKFIATEVNYAIAEKRKKTEEFAIITLVFQDNDGNTGIIPDLLKPYVWKTPKNDLEAFREIIRALPIKVGNIIWK